MRCYQEKNDFKPIILTIETAEEAFAFFDLIDKLNVYSCPGPFKPFKITQEEKDIIIYLSNTLTCGDVVL